MVTTNLAQDYQYNAISTASTDHADMDLNNFLSLRIELDVEADGRWIAEINHFPGVLAYGKTLVEAVDKVKSISEAVVADFKKSGKLSQDLIINYVIG